MTWESWTWLGMVLMFLAVEGIALKQRDLPGHPRTLSANVWWLVRGAGYWHQVARIALITGMSVLTIHLLS